jgi:predicted kinase
MMKKIPVFTLMVGLPGSGKSRWVARHKGSAVVVCLDDMRILVFGHEFRQQVEQFVIGACKAMATLLLHQGKDVILDSTAATRRVRREWLALAADEGADTRIVWVDTPVEICLDRRRNDPDRKVPSGVVRGMAMAFDVPVDGEANKMVKVNGGRK